MRQSDLIRDIFALPSSPDVEEGTDKRPLVLPEVSAAGLADLFKMMYNLWGSELPLSDDEFVEVLLTAHRLQVHGAVKILLGILDRRIPAERKLQLGLRCDLEFWQLRAFQELVLGFQPMAQPLLSESVWLKVCLARARISQARIEHILSTLASSACGHVLAALLATVPFASPYEYRTKYAACRAGLGKPAVSSGFGSGGNMRRPHQCCSSASFRIDDVGGQPDDMHTVLLPSATESAIIAAVWNALRDGVEHTAD